VAAVFLLGFGIGMSFASMANLIVEAVPQHQTGEATGMNTIMRTVGGAFGAQIAAAIVTGHLEPGTGYAAESGFTTAFAMGTVALLIALGAGALIPGRRARSAREDGTQMGNAGPNAIGRIGSAQDSQVNHQGAFMARAEAKIKEGAAPFLQEGEEVLAAIVARPRGWTQQNASPGGGLVAGMVGGAMGGKKQQENVAAADDSGFEITSPMALAVTDRRLLCFKISNPVGLGIGGDVKELVSEAPLSAVDSIEVKRLAVGKTVNVSVRGTPFVLEVGAGANAKGVAEEFERAKAPA
jgi:MFS family permease